MTRNFAVRLAHVLIGYADSHKYPTRSVEYMLAWMMVAWSAMLALPGKMLVGPHYSYLVQLMPESSWAGVGLSIGFLRLFALVRNGNWKRSPYFRLLGATVGFNFWFVLFALYGIAIMGGAPAFPMFGCLPVFMFFEVYSAFRCGQDARGA